MPDPEGVRTDTTEEPQPVQLLHYRLAGLLAAHTLERTTSVVDRPVRIHDVDRIQAKPAAYLEVVGVMRRGDLEDTRTELGIYVLVGEDLYLSLDERHHYPAPDEIFVPLILRVDDERHVAEHRLRTGREDVCVIDLQVTDRRTVVGAPVGDTVAAVDQTFVVQADKGRQDSVDVIVIHGVPEATPVE